MLSQVLLVHLSRGTSDLCTLESPRRPRQSGDRLVTSMTTCTSVGAMKVGTIEVVDIVVVTVVGATIVTTVLFTRTGGIRSGILDIRRFVQSRVFDTLRSK